MSLDSVYGMKLYAQLKPDAITQVRQMGSQYRIGQTNVTPSKGLVFAEVLWGVDGTDMPISAEIAEMVTGFMISWKQTGKTMTCGLYNLLDEDGEVRARGLIDQYNNWTITSSERKPVAELYRLMLCARITPAEEHSDTRTPTMQEQINNLEVDNSALHHLLTKKTDELAAALTQIEAMNLRFAGLSGLVHQLHEATSAS